MRFTISTIVVVAFFFLVTCQLRGQSPSWKRHTIDKTSRGADGIRTADVNRDGLLDLVTGWEEGGKIRVYINPGPAQAHNPWPAETVGDVKSPEDAVFADLDGDGKFDVVSSCEGKTQTVFVHWANDGGWTTESFPKLKGRLPWMFATPLDIDQTHGVDLIIGAKGTNAQLGWLKSPSQPRQLAVWHWFPLVDVGWVMSIVTVDMDGDRDLDVLYTDRKGSSRGVHWLEYVSDADLTRPWKRRTIGGADREVMFLSVGDLNEDGMQDIAVAVKDGPITWFERQNASGDKWTQHEIEMPPGTGSGKGVAIIDVNLDGQQDVVFSCEHSQQKVGVGWMSPTGESERWEFHDVSGSQQGIKFDLIQTIDLDADGDLDVLTCEERDNLGVIWYENPTR